MTGRSDPRVLTEEEKALTILSVNRSEMLVHLAAALCPEEPQA